MTSNRASPITVVWILGLLSISLITAENIDPPNDGSQYAWAENVGWLNAEPNGDGGPGVQVGDSELSGWMWGENIGWVSLSCKNTLSCSTVDYGVVNDGFGSLSGFAYSENVGWVSFSCGNTASCGVADYGVFIDPTIGDFSGEAWAENVGWVRFASTGANPYKVTSGWMCSPPPASPSGTTSITVNKSANGLVLQWTGVTGATGFDIVSGDLAALRSSGGDFSSATVLCQDDNRTTTNLLDSSALAAGQAVWFLVRGQNCGGSGAYESAGSSQVGVRDAEVAASGNDCP